ncbi:integrase domain-containing protein [Paraburkholderia acidisoli]|uniref:Core-binding (CB) domain-containing protein n=1 Tax=Paraburkholderia acidisoli TaxID=2571748 RepID=A0A7Z2JEU6_9BURK|nr:integrase domain-containing protein [Paraburkholderia acidisoli]QGZ62106.1 hypothetical protein FAZ98_10405 [Paraburkholderia acidisoli]
MSHKSLAADLCRAARSARGKQADHTRKGRDQSLMRFAVSVWEAGFQVHTAGGIKEKHIEAWAADMESRGLSKRTRANNLAHIRTALEGVGRRPFADKLSNSRLDAAGASRAGTKRPMPHEALAVYLPTVAAIDPGVAVVLELMAQFGLRAEEGVRAVKSLADWLRALRNPAADGFVTVIHGTKGGKTRRSPSLDRQHAATLVERAIDLTKASGGKLVRKPDLKRAMDRFHYVVRKAGMTGADAPHSLRYAYTAEHLRRLKAVGVSRREAAAGVSTWLGHGDGRGTWVEYVYGRKELAAEEVGNA